MGYITLDNNVAKLKAQKGKIQVNKHKESTKVKRRKACAFAPLTGVVREFRGMTNDYRRREKQALLLAEELCNYLKQALWLVHSRAH